MTRKTCLCFAVAAVLSLAAASDSQAFWGSRGGWGSCGSSGGSWGGGSGGGWGGSSGSWGSSGSSGSHGGIFSRIFNRGGGSHGSNGGWGSNGSSGSSGSHGSNGSAGGAAYYGGGGGYYTAAPTQVTYAVAKAQTAVKTQLTLRVPADAKVTLAGVATKQTGETRQFSSSQLAEGQAWQNYQVVVEMDRNGKTVREERTITLVGGQAQELAIGAAETKLARLAP